MAFQSNFQPYVEEIILEDDINKFTAFISISSVVLASDDRH